ncbi:response regulator [Amantichitinum ursilacus]|uniref:Chemotaxis protein CheY n=1 Tax=Amantichitinum ursilacus TaxID=857265 RepID=A0A0N0GQ49_9NEIS|nr:response regulator [Amantichitinum ursilacus]KPC54103.1 Chemotaxis protein CheY [Amantichitinum ursilacus]
MNDAVEIPSLVGARALVIDRANEMRAALGTGLAEFGVETIDYVGKPADALARINAHAYDVVLCEYDLGQGFDGLHLFESCQQHQLLKPSCIFMMITGERRLAQVMGAVELVPDGYLLKPFSGAEFANRLARALKRKGGFRRIDAAVRSGDYQGAIAACDREIHLRPLEAPEFQRMKGHLQLMIAEYAAAETTYRQAMSQRQAPWAQMGLGRALFGLKDYSSARTCFEAVSSQYELMIQAYDWLARTQNAQGDPKGAQSTLGRALQRSPLVAQRQRAMGRLAERNGELQQAEGALTQALELSRGSFWREPAIYGELGRVQVARSDVGAARRTMQRLRTDFKGDTSAEVIGQLVEAAVLEALDDHKRSEQMFRAACEQLDALEDVPANVLLEASRHAYARQQKERGEHFARAALRSAHDDAELLASVEGLYLAQGDAETGRRLIENATRDIADINNLAIDAAKAGDLQRAAEHFITGLAAVKGNVQVLLNAANTLLTCVNQEGWNERYMTLVNQYLQRVRRLDPANGKARQLNEAFRRTQFRYGIDAETGRKTGSIS